MADITNLIKEMIEITKDIELKEYLEYWLNKLKK
jgi:hypothetical protein